MSDPLPIEISVAEAARLLSSDAHALLLDCRTPEEHDTARIARARLFPMHEIAARIGELEAWRERAIVVHCHHGVRSLRVAEWLRGRGFNATSMQSGIEGWSAEVDPAVPRY